MAAAGGPATDGGPPSAAAVGSIRAVPQVRAIGRVITAWGTADGRTSRRPELPWRSTRDPWAVLVSEIMAQQTQVGRVAPVFRRFLDRFPDPPACAAAPLGDVLRAWQGMGYNRRARHLHLAAAVMVDEHRGRVPATLDALLALPGVGPYTARAVLAFAFEQDIGVVDTNAGRVLARAVAGRRLAVGETQQVVDAMVPDGNGWAFGQALLDLGATVCRGPVPACARCPIRRRCRWAARGRPPPDPARGSAGVSVRQSRFEGSDRQGRGRLLDALRLGPVAPGALPSVLGWPDDRRRARRVADALVSEGLAERDATGTFRLP